MALNLMAIWRLCDNTEDLVRTLQQWGLIPANGSYMCKVCGKELVIYDRQQSPDSVEWACNGYVVERKQKTRRCRYRVSIRTGTFFAASKLSMRQILGFVILWVQNSSLKLIQNELAIGGSDTVVDWSSFCREVLVHAFLDKPEKLGGEGKIVEIDESKFGKRKYHRGHHVDGAWVLGGYERGTGRVFMVVVESRGKDVLIPIIKQWIHPGTTIYSDCWKAYDCLPDEGFEHESVNHSKYFKDPETGVHTNCIESSWRAAKAIMSSSGRKKVHLAGNLARYMFYKRCAEAGLDRAKEFYRLAGVLYDATSKDGRDAEADMVEDQSAQQAEPEELEEIEV